MLKWPIKEQIEMERRRFTRFKVKDDAYAALRGNYTKVGKICDISLNGLAFNYLAEKIYDETLNLVDIFLSKNEFHLSGVPCTVVCDKEECAYSSPVITQYRCCLKFERLNEEHSDKLEFFINNHTTGVIT